MARNSYRNQLETLREDVIAMSDLVCERLRRALSALESKDEALAEAVATGDHEINRLYLDLEGECIELFALQQPVAGDLRFVASSFKIVTDLERIGDLATNLATYAIEAERDRYPEIDIAAIGARTAEMVADAMAAYADADADAAREIAARDDELDRLCEDASAVVVRDLLRREGAPGLDRSIGDGDGPIQDGDGPVPDGDGPIEGVDGAFAIDDDEALYGDVSRMLLTIRDLERIGDHAVNVAARTLYVVENDDELIF